MKPSEIYVDLGNKNAKQYLPRICLALYRTWNKVYLFSYQKTCFNIFNCGVQICLSNPSPCPLFSLTHNVLVFLMYSAGIISCPPYTFACLTGKCLFSSASVGSAVPCTDSMIQLGAQYSFFNIITESVKITVKTICT